MAAAATEPEFCTVREAAEIAHSSPTSIRQWVREGRLGNYGTPGKRLIDVAELRALIREGPTKHPEPPRRPGE